MGQVNHSGVVHKSTRMSPGGVSRNVGASPAVMGRPSGRWPQRPQGCPQNLWTTPTIGPKLKTDGTSRGQCVGRSDGAR